MEKDIFRNLLNITLLNSVVDWRLLFFKEASSKNNFLKDENFPHNILTDG
jgi:hypothetical protein